MEDLPTKGHLSSYQMYGEEFVEDVYFLMSIFATSKHLVDIDIDQHRNENPPYSGVQCWSHLAELIEMRHIPRRLISIAISYRMGVDDGRWWNSEDRSVGLLTDDINNPDTTTEVKLRLACNKIIHAKKLHYDIEVVENLHWTLDRVRYLHPSLYLYGEKHDKKWLLHLRIYDFCNSCIETIF